MPCSFVTCEPNVEGFAVFDFTCRKPLVAFWTFALPTDTVLDLFSASSLVNDLVDEELLLAVSEDGRWWMEHTMGKEVVVVFLEWLD